MELCWINKNTRTITSSTILRNLQNNIEGFYQKAKLTPEIISLRNGIQTANSIVLSAIEAKQSKGTHYIEN